MEEDRGFLVLLSEDLFFNSKRDTTRGLDLIALGSLDIIRAAVCFALESAIVGRRVTGRRFGERPITAE